METVSHCPSPWAPTATIQESLPRQNRRARDSVAGVNQLVSAKGNSDFYKANAVVGVRSLVTSRGRWIRWANRPPTWTLEARFVS